jgi:cytochrome c7-like protein
MNPKLSIALLFIIIQNAVAQLSPGDLSQVHADLEGLSNCTKCHEIGEKVQPQNCLSCHKILDERIKAGKGLHADAGYEDCADCHSEHHGREYKLIYWDDGQENFEHKETGFELLGKHAALKCQNCHSPENIRDKQKLQSQKKDLNKTFLGLSQDCLSCHQDEHRGQMLKNCLNCHDMLGWKPAPKFDHDKNKFRLTGLHNKVQCKSCHKTITDNKFEDDKSYLKFAGLKFDNCIDCHKNPHSNKFGQKCESCHNTTGWQNYSKNRFDHNKTRYPLQGKHSLVNCEKCHGRKKSKKIARFNNCQDCHKDFHNDQFRDRPLKGKCEECHSVNGFTPANFTINNHENTKYPLTGSHLAIPCIACHEVTGRRNQITLQFDFQNTKCKSCHLDPHIGQVDKYKKMNINAGCEYCHGTEGWQHVQFDHTQTQFLLEGKHNLIRCNKCHISENNDFIKFEQLSMECSSCHDDIHKGQFKDAQDKTDCGKCHKPIDWFAEKFDHEIHSIFKLQGAHSQVACEKCHKDENVLGTSIVRYKPLNSECKACHIDLKDAQKGIQ